MLNVTVIEYFRSKNILIFGRNNAQRPSLLKGFNTLSGKLCRVT